MQDLYAETVSAVNFSNGVVRMVFVDQDPATLAEKDADPSKVAPRLKQQVVMPLPGFLYMLTVIRGLMEEPKMQDLIKRYTELGLLPSGPEERAATETGEGDSAAA